jgi:hypothetical protein
VKVFNGLDDFVAAKGSQIGPTDWTRARVGAKLRARSQIADVTELDGAVQATLVTTVEVDGSEKPAAVIESIVRYVA